MLGNKNPLMSDLDEMLHLSGSMWDSFRGARIFLTGGTGFFGQWLLESFVWANHHKALGASVVVLSRNPEAFIARAPHLAGGAVTFHPGDIRSFVSPAGTFTHVIHAATESSGGQHGHDRLHMADTILTGTRRVLEFARHAQVGRMLYISSSAIYGRNRAVAAPIAESDATAPLLTDANIEYDESKRMAEALCVLYHREFGLSVSIARCFAFVGPHLPRDGHFAVGNFIRDALAGKPIQVQGDGSAVRSYLYTADLVRWLWTILAQGNPAHPYNVGSNEAVSIAQLADQVRQTVNPGSAVTIAGTPGPSTPLNYQVPDIRRTADELGLRPSVTLEEAIRRTAQWYREHPAIAPSPQAAAPKLTSPDAIVFDFDGVMTDNRVIVFQDTREAVLCDRADGLGIDALHALGIPMLVLSTETNPVVAARCKKLRLECLQGIAVKETVLGEWLKERGHRPERTIYVGNDLNDLGCLQLVGFPVAVSDAYPEAKALAKLVLNRPGGMGAVRALADILCAARAGDS